jgi:hypothetical protein
MKADVLLGLQWGDEGKGKIVDVLTPNYQVIARFQGGPNAGHTLEFNGIKHVLHTIPSGIFRPDAVNVIGNGVVIDPVILMKEITALRNMGVNMKESLRISKKAHLILPTHKVLDAASEAQKGTSKILDKRMKYNDKKDTSLEQTDDKRVKITKLEDFILTLVERTRMINPTTNNIPLSFFLMFISYNPLICII